MAITKGGVKLENARFQFDENGEVTGLLLDANFAYLEDGEQTVRQRKTVDAWALLSGAEQTTARTIGKKLLALATAGV
tara:strand:+ start:197 stop:430 length:234 start_codon:yes stop_codon:yes gene_type:complete